MTEFLKSIPQWVFIVVALPGIFVIAEWLVDGVWGDLDRDEDN